MPVNHLSEVERVELQLEAAMAARPRDNAAYVGATNPAAVPRPVAWSWFPADEYDQALAQWPTLTEPGAPAAGGRPHAEYCRALQVKLAEAADAGMTSIRIAPIRVDALLAWCAERGEEPRDARSGYVAALAQTDPEQLISWPPGRNEPCWCGSARKYKKCCGAPRTGDHG